ncbi:meiotic recombination [Kalmusia sp. IMI 367209]|nr:meiotic recombination [Kalmusia sp. IMI 367209]
MPSQAPPQGSPPSRQADSNETDNTPLGPDVIRILVATDSHVGYNERDPVRKDDSWKTFHEVMCLAKEHDVDMVLHGGDLFHENKPSRMSMYHVTQSLRMNCLGDKPCELEMLSDASENFGGVFDHVNYEDPDINVAIPVFAIHGNHDDPSGEGHFSALDLLQASGLINYYGRTSEVDKIEIKPVLLQKGNTKLALYGLSNVRDERLFHTWRNGDVKFFQPEVQTNEWFNLMSVHQNHVAHTPTSFLPENFLPEFIDLVIWGHEHECLIEPKLNPEMGFQVIQPGSSVATSLMPGEAMPKHVAILSIDTSNAEKERKFWCQPIRLKSVRPFIMKDIVLQEQQEVIDRQLWRVSDNKNKISSIVIEIIEDLIEEAKREWLELQDDRDEDEEIEVPLPLVRLRVEYTAPEPGEFKIENPQRLSNKFQGKVANVNDVVMFHRKKKTASRMAKATVDLPDDSAMAQLSIDTVKVEKLVKEFLTAQSLSILPQNSFGDAVAQFVDKDDKHAMETFVKDSLRSQQKHLLGTHEIDVDELVQEMEHDFDGPWEDSPDARANTDSEEDEDLAAAAQPRKPAARGRGKAAGTTRQTVAATKKATTTTKKAPAPKTTRGKKKAAVEEEEDDVDEDSDVIMIEDNNIEGAGGDSDSGEDLFVGQRSTATKPASKAPTRAKSPAKKTAATRTRAPATKQSTLNFSQSSAQRGPTPRASTQRAAASRAKKVIEEDEDEISDDEDAFEPPPTSRVTRRR